VRRNDGTSAGKSVTVLAKPWFGKSLNVGYPGMLRILGLLSSPLSRKIHHPWPPLSLPPNSTWYLVLRKTITKIYHNINNMPRHHPVLLTTTLLTALSCSHANLVPQSLRSKAQSASFICKCDFNMPRREKKPPSLPTASLAGLALLGREMLDRTVKAQKKCSSGCHFDMHHARFSDLAHIASIGG